MTHAVGLVDSISYVASRSKKLSKLGLKMVLHVGAIWAVYYYLDVYETAASSLNGPLGQGYIRVGSAMLTRTLGLQGDVTGTPSLFYALDIY